MNTFCSVIWSNAACSAELSVSTGECKGQKFSVWCIFQGQVFNIHAFDGRRHTSRGVAVNAKTTFFYSVLSGLLKNKSLHHIPQKGKYLLITGLFIMAHSAKKKKKKKKNNIGTTDHNASYVVGRFSLSSLPSLLSPLNSKLSPLSFSLSFSLSLSLSLSILSSPLSLSFSFSLFLFLSLSLSISLSLSLTLPPSFPTRCTYYLAKKKNELTEIYIK